MAKVILTYGTFDMYHEGHRKVIENSKKEGYKLFVGVASDEYVKRKGKSALLSYEMRKKLLEADPLVDFVFPEESLNQWKVDYEKFGAEVIRISEEHEEEISSYKELSDLNIAYFPRTPNVSTSNIKELLRHKNVVITYGTYDLLHHGHLNIFESAKALGDILIVGVSTDEFNSSKGKEAHESFSERINHVWNNSHVDYVIPELSWAQKEKDIKYLNVNTFTMGSDWQGKFDELLSTGVKIKILDRTEGISSTKLRKELKGK